MKFATRILTALAAMFLYCSPVLAGNGPHKLAIQISDDDPVKMTTVLNVAANVSKSYTDKAEEIDIKIVAFNAGLHMLRSDTSPVAERIKSFNESMPNVEFQACNNTRMGMAKKEGKEIPLLDGAHVVEAGVVSLMELHESGYVIIRP